MNIKYTNREIAEAFGGALRQIRKEQKLPMKVFADELNVSIAQISRWETGINSLYVETFVRFTQILEVTVSEVEEIANGILQKGN